MFIHFLNFLSYIRSPIAFMYIACSCIFLGPMLILVSFFIKNDHPFKRSMRVLWCKSFFSLAGIKAQLEGLENIPKDSHLVLFNHTSILDILLIVMCLPVTVRFVSKRELSKIPIFGSILRAEETILIDRSNRSKTISTYHQVAKEAQSRFFSIAIAPEGTRQREEKLGDFKSGPFLLALEAQMPIVPVVISGALETLPPKSLRINCGKWKRKVFIKILPSVDISSYPPRSHQKLKQKIHQDMKVGLSELIASTS